MPKNIYNSEDVLNVDNNSLLTVAFPNKVPFTIDLKLNGYSNELINKIKNHEYCNGCKNLSSFGYNGSKRSWCKFSRLIANFTPN